MAALDLYQGHYIQLQHMNLPGCVRANCNNTLFRQTQMYTSTDKQKETVTWN